MTRTTKALASAGVLSLALAVTGCSSNSTPTASDAGSKGDAKAAMFKAFDGMGDQTEGTLKVTFDGSKDDVRKIAGLDGKSGDVPEGIADFIAGMSLSMGMKATDGVKFKDRTSVNTVDLAMDISSGSLVSRVWIAQQAKKLYVQAPITDLMKKLAGQDLSGQMSGAPAWLAGLMQGKPTGMSLPDGLLKQAMPTATPTTATYQDMKTLLDKHATFTDKGDKDGGRAIKVEIKLKPFLKDSANLAPYATKTGSATSPASTSAENVADDAVLTLDTVVKDGVLTAVDWDMNQIKTWPTKNPTGSDNVKADIERIRNLDLKSVLRLRFDKTANVEPPKDAYVLTDQEMAQLGGLMSAVS